MAEQALESRSDSGQTLAARWWRDVVLVGVLMLLAVTLRGWMMANTEVLARDSIGYIRYALEFETDRWPTVLKNNHQHPGYPLTILGTSVLVRRWGAGSEVELMSFSAQLASNIAAVLLVIPMFFLGKVLFHRAAGFGAAALFQCLPVPAHILSDGLSESLFLLLACITLLTAVLAMRGSSPWLFALCGLCSGLTYLTRPEGALLAAATLLVLVGLRLARIQPRSMRQLLTCGGALTLTAVIVGLPYLFATQRISNKPSIYQMFNQELPGAEAARPDELSTTSSMPPLSNAQTPLACIWGITLNLQDAFGKRAWQAGWGLAGELVKCFHYFAWPPVLLGMWWYRRRLAVEPGMWVLIVLSALFAVVLWWLAVRVGYMSDRHLLLVVLCGCLVAAAAVMELPKRCVAWWQGFESGTTSHSRWTLTVAGFLFCLMLGAGLPKTLVHLHGNRAGHHAAGLWLADHAADYDAIEDDHCWAHFYAGRVFQERKPIVVPPGQAPVRFVVVGRRDHEINLTWNRGGPPSETKLKADGGRIVYHWPTQQNPEEAPIVIYAVSPSVPPTSSRPD